MTFDLLQLIKKVYSSQNGRTLYPILIVQCWISLLYIVIVMSVHGRRTYVLHEDGNQVIFLSRCLLGITHAEGLVLPCAI